jgi:hypothetical protein
MAILNITTDVTGQIGVNPRRVAIVSTDDFDTITAAGYLNNSNLMDFDLYPTDVIDMTYSFNKATNKGLSATLYPYITSSSIKLGGILFTSEAAQQQAIKINDQGYPALNMVMSPGPLITGNLVQAVNNGSTSTTILQDTGYNLLFDTASWIGGGTSHTFTTPGLLTEMPYFVDILANTNPATIVSHNAGNGTMDVTFNTNPGVVTIVYLAKKPSGA